MSSDRGQIVSILGIEILAKYKITFSTSILIPPSEVEQQPLLWVEVLSQSKIRDTFSTYPVAECTIKEVASKLKHLKDKNLLDLTKYFWKNNLHHMYLVLV